LLEESDPVLHSLLKDKSEELDSLRFEMEVTSREMEQVKEQKASLQQELSDLRQNLEVSSTIHLSLVKGIFKI
jgi:hypothetical protein